MFAAPTSVENADWKSNLYKELHLDGPGMLKELFNRVAAELQKDFQAPSKVPVLVLDILRETTQGARRSAFGACASFPA